MPAPPLPVCPPVAVLNPEGRDPFIDYREGPAGSQPGTHPPVNFHAFAACTRGAFCQRTRDVLDRDPGRFQHVILLLRRRIAPCLRAARELHAAGLQVFAAWKECGAGQIADQLAEPGVWAACAEVFALARGVISPTGCAVPLPPAPAAPLATHPLPTPYPVDLAAWDVSLPVPERSGIFLGTREFLQPTRNHLAALALALRAARQAGTHVSVINSDKQRGRRLLQAMAAGLPAACLRVIEGPLPYDVYLRAMAGHRVVFQMDRSGVPGQVAGDALLCRSVCVGGNSFLEQLAFPEHCFPALPESALPDHLAGLLTDDRLLGEAIAHSQTLAADKLSFAAGARDLGRILAGDSPGEDRSA